MDIKAAVALSAAAIFVTGAAAVVVNAKVLDVSDATPVGNAVIVDPSASPSSTPDRTVVVEETITAAPAPTSAPPVVVAVPPATSPSDDRVAKARGDDSPGDDDSDGRQDRRDREDRDDDEDEDHSSEPVETEYGNDHSEDRDD